MRAWWARFKARYLFEGPYLVRHDEQGGEAGAVPALTYDEESFLVGLEQEMAKEARLARKVPVVPGDAWRRPLT
jgi:hypothetical protein